MKHKSILTIFTIFLLVACVFMSAVTVSADPPAPPTYYTYEEYLAAIEGLDLPERFVHFDALSHLGTFKRATVHRSDYYEYALQTEGGAYITVTVNHRPTNIFAEYYWTMELDIADLRDLNNAEPPVDAGASGHLQYLYCLGDLRYIYNKDMELTAIKRMQDGLEITISGWGQDLSKYPISESSVVGKLLNKEHALAAYEEHFLPITASTDPVEPSGSAKGESTEKLFLVAAVSAVSGAVVATVVAACITAGKKKKKPAEQSDEQNII